MSKNIRQKIAHAIQSTFRQSSPSESQKPSSLKSKLATCCNVTKPADYEYIEYLPKPTKSSLASRDDYIDLSECHSSISPSTSIDSGISYHTNISSISSSNQNLHQLHSTTNGDDEDETCEFSTLSNLSYIPRDQMNISNFDVTGWNSIPTTFECCQCQCHHHAQKTLERNDVNHLFYVPESSRERRTKNEVFPVIF